MGTSKTEIFSERHNSLARWSKVLGHPARIAIIEHLLNSSSCICGDLVDEIGLAQSTISQHLKALKEANLIKGDISGTSVCYCINTEEWTHMTQMMASFLKESLSKCQEC